MRSLLKFKVHVVEYDDTVSGAAGLWKDHDTREWLITREITDSERRIAYHETSHTSLFFAQKEFDTAALTAQVQANNHALWKLDKLQTGGQK